MFKVIKVLVKKSRFSGLAFSKKLSFIAISFDDDISVKMSSLCQHKSGEIRTFFIQA